MASARPCSSIDDHCLWLANISCSWWVACFSATQIGAVGDSFSVEVMEEIRCFSLKILRPSARRKSLGGTSANFRRAQIVKIAQRLQKSLKSNYNTPNSYCFWRCGKSSNVGGTAPLGPLTSALKVLHKLMLCSVLVALLAGMQCWLNLK